MRAFTKDLLTFGLPNGGWTLAAPSHPAAPRRRAGVVFYSIWRSTLVLVLCFVLSGDRLYRKVDKSAKVNPSRSRGIRRSEPMKRFCGPRNVSSYKDL